MRVKIVLILVILLGCWLRYDTYNRLHPDNDGIYELEQVTKDLRLVRIFDNKTVYGDHTSYPGEFLVYWLPLKLLNKDIKVYMQEQRVEGLTRGDIWWLASPKIIITLLGFIGLFLYFKDNVYGIVGMMMYAFNNQLVYHAFEMRPYAVLPELAIFNFLLCHLAFKNSKGYWILYSLLFFFTCIYHAYGVLIAGLPFIYYLFKQAPCRDRCFKAFIGVVVASLGAWAYYASFNTFGVTPNANQAVVDPFQYMPVKNFFTNMFSQLTGGGLLMTAIAPVLLIRAFKMGKSDWLFLGVLVVLPITLICLVDLKTSYWIHPRQYLWVIPFFVIFISKQLEEICRQI